MAAPRIALLVHNRYEQDPRVSRHARAALRAGYRVAVLSVGSAGAAPRWGEAAGDGARVYESRVVRRTWLGRLRALAGRASGSFPRRAATAEVAALPAGAAPSCGESDAVGAGRWLRGLRDWWTVALLVRNNLGVYRQFRGIGAALVHANDLNVLLAGYLLARAWGVPLIYDSHELWTQLDEGWSPLLRKLFAWLEGPLLRRANAVVTVNEPIARELARMYGAPLPTVIMNCPEAPAEAPRAGIGPRAPGRLRVIYQGMLNPNRGLEGLIDAVSMLEGVTLTIRGPGALGPALQQHINNRSETTIRIQIEPPVPMEQLIEALDGYDIGVVPYLPVGKNNLFCSPNKLFEYMAAGLAVVCSDLPVLREVVSAAGCGEVYESGNVAALASVLRQLAEDPDLLATYKRRARHAVETRYNASHEEGKLLALYRELLEGPTT